LPRTPGSKAGSTFCARPVHSCFAKGFTASTGSLCCGSTASSNRSARKSPTALVFSRDRDQEMYDQNMREYLGIDEEVLKEIAAKG
jgi:hypothetical protein